MEGHISGEESDDGEPVGDTEESVPRLPAVGSVASQAMMAGRSWLPDDLVPGFANRFQPDNHPAGSPALQPVMDMVARTGREGSVCRT
jgi:hypothetical protein